jgi:threonine dehydrogenase-like Zn-dependent dehydrogenase
MGKSIQFIRSAPRWLIVRGLAGRASRIATGALSCIKFAETPPPELPTAQWVRINTHVSGICGSDLSTVACSGSPYFSPFVSTPFVLGHEIMGRIIETGADVPRCWRSGMRVVIEPALGCEVRGIERRCRACLQGWYAHCERICDGSIRAGIQTGYCASTGGGWSDSTLVAHYSQLHLLPESVSDKEGVLAEPLACSLHAALQAPAAKSSTLLVIGCGTIGLLAIWAYRRMGGKGRVLAAARHLHQARMARQLGADDSCVGRDSDELYRWVLENSGSEAGRLFRPELGKPVVLGGVDFVMECVGSSQAIDDALRLTRSRGTVVLVGMPGIGRGIDWTSAWHKELRVQGAYAYGWEERADGGRVKTMQLAIELIESGEKALEPLVTSRFALEEYRAALDHAFNAGRCGAFKTVFQIES